MPALAYRIVVEGGQPVVAWDPEPVTQSNQELLYPEAQRGDKLEYAKNLIVTELEASPMLATEMETAARMAGLSRATFLRARSTLRKSEIIECQGGGKGRGQSVWRLNNRET